MKKTYHYKCPSCGSENEITLSRWSGLSIDRTWDCPRCGEHLRSAYARPIIHGIARIALFSGMIAHWISGPAWYIIPVLILAFFGLESLLGAPRVVVHPRPRDFVAEELEEGIPGTLVQPTSESKELPNKTWMGNPH